MTIDALGALQKCVMETIWELGEATVGQVRDRRQREPQPAYTTILSVMQKLEDVYHKSRSTLRVEPGKVLELDDHVGLHPSLKDLHRLWETGELAVVQGVGYPDPNRSHFRSMEIWQTGTVGPAPPAGWLAGAAWRCTPPAGALPCRAGVDAAGRAGAEGGGPVTGQRRRVLPRQEGSSQTGNHGTTPPYGRGSPPCGRGPAPGKDTETGS
ncbi:MAG: BlaI/MecI/CopY family transcriptional regulator [Isosphaeraceae bacterium]